MSDRRDTLKRIPLAEPYLGGNEKEYLLQCVETNYVSSVGPFVQRFEEEFAQYLGVPYAVATCNGTAAIHVALQLAGVKAGDEVLVSTFTFIASVNPIRYLGATPVLVDSEEQSWNLNPDLVMKEVRRRAEVGRLPKAILVVHIYGFPAQIGPILEIAARYDIPVIEDAAESLGATFEGKNVGTLGLMGCFSFNGNKVVTAGGGGMIVTKDPEMARLAKHLTQQARLPGMEYRHDMIGYNYRLTNIQAALGLAQQEQLTEFLRRKHEIAAKYKQLLKDVPGIEFPAGVSNTRSSDWMFSVLIDPDGFGRSRPEVLDLFKEVGVECRPVWNPVHTMPMYASCPRLGGAVAEMIFSKGIALPSSVGLSDSDQDLVIASLKRFCRS